VNRQLLADFADSFKRLNVSVNTMHARSGRRHSDRQVNACVLHLRESAIAWLNRSDWFRPRRTVVYGIGGSRAARRFAELGINALLENGSYDSVRAAVESTHSLLSRGVGKCGRVPIAADVEITGQGRTLTGVTKNVGYGGLAVRVVRNAALPDLVTLNFTLPYAGSFSLAASPRWYSGCLVGLRFEPSSQETVLKQWVHDYSLLGCSDL
jgi:hypothetical protein